MLKPILTTLEMIKFEHTLFALPFAFLAAFTAANGVPAAMTAVWILVAMVGARSAAMAFNRLVDTRIDAENPRTKMRALPAGLVSGQFVILFIIASSALLVFAAWKLNGLAFLLSPVALLIVFGYSLCKRFTSLSHLVLGLSLAIAPIGAAIAVEGRFDPRIFPLAFAVVFWTGGFDVLYSLQDVEFDREKRLFSLPARFGPANAILLARLFHLITIGCLVTFGVWNHFGWLYWIGVGAAVLLLIWQHSIVSPTDISRINAAFFTANGILSIALFIFGACDILLRGR